jgi:hypothetical protein
MKSRRKTLHELSSHIPPKTPKRNISSSTNEMLHTDIIDRAQRTRVNNTHAREAKNCHQNSHAINQTGRHRRQPAPILQGKGMGAPCAKEHNKICLILQIPRVRISQF